MSHIWGSAYNRLTGERMNKPKRPRILDFNHLSEWISAHHKYISDMKKWDAFIAEIPAYAVWERPKLVHAKEKGIPVPRTGTHRSWRSGKNSGKSGVIGNSRVLPHRYMDEGDKGAAHNRHIKRVERAQWLREWQREEEDTYDAETVAQWFYDTTDDVASDIIPSVYTVGETVVEWPDDYYDEYGYSESYGCGDEWCNICGTPEPDPYEDDWCGHCGGPCEL